MVYSNSNTKRNGVVVVGAGYIAVELAGIFNTLESEAHLLVRGETVLQSSDLFI
jgi:glutathione reductase (NADPH)